MEKIIEVNGEGHLIETNEIVDWRAHRASCRIDARSDRNWFQRNPKVNERIRPISGRERKTYGLAKSAKMDVLVIRLDDGMQARVVMDPVFEKTD